MWTVVLLQKMGLSKNKEIGNIGEEKGKEFLKKKGYQIICSNYRCCLGEIDLIARDKSTIVFVEIKTRQGFEYGLPYEAVNKKKQKKIVKSALYYLQQNKLTSQNYRFDILSLLSGKIEHLEGAFSPDPSVGF